ELRFRSFLTDEQYQTLRRKIALADGKGMIRDMKTGAIIVDDLNHGETEELLRVLKPDIFLSGLKDPYVLQKAGVVSRQLHCHDYSGPYAGFQGAVNFARDITMGLYTPAWRFVTPPWKNQPLRRARRRAGGGEENVAVNA
ncbi:MAG: nitrogenase molybdenum-iron protein alpha chain, partial [Peptococcaceae bacterium]|nr:nitrogenase molybdenum-iron protein alpha chain [Peptococcaceae bacterium]